MKQSFILIAMCLMVHGFSQDCNSILLGKLTDFHDGSDIVGASIYIKKLNITAVSDNNGKFRIEGLCDGKIELLISHLACESKTLEITIDGDTFKSIELEHHVETLNEVAITGSNTKKQSKTAQETILKTEDLVKYSSLSLGDALKEVPGVSSINTGNSIVKPMINGMYGSRLLILTNNVRLQDQEWGVEHAPNFDINSADQISVIKGAGSLAYGGDAVGGVVVIKPSSIKLKDTLSGQTITGIQSNGRGYNLATTLNKSYKSGWFVNLQGSLKQNGDFNAPDYNLTNTGLQSQAISLRTGKRKFESGFEVFYSYINSEIGILGASHIGSVFDLIRAINSGQPVLIEDFSYEINPPKQEITHHLAKVNYYKRLKNFGKLKLQYDYQHNQRFEFDVRIGDRREIPAIDLTLQTHTVLADVNLDSNLERKVNFGIMGRFQDNFANPDTGVRRLIPDYFRYDFGAYVTSEWSLNENLLFDAGVRYDFNRIDAKKFYLKSRWEERGYDEDFSDIIIEEFPTQYLTNPIFDYHNFSASAGLRLDLNGGNQIILNYNLASRPPNVAELFSDGLHHSAARFEIGDIRFDQEISNRISGSYSFSNSRFNVLAEVFYNRIQDFIYLRPFDLILTLRGPFPLWAYQQTNAELVGLDLNIGYELTNNLQLQSKSALIKGYDKETDLPLIDIPAFSTINSITYTNEKWNGFSASIRSEWVFEQNEFPDFNFEVEDQLTGEDILVDISTPPPAYCLFDFYSEANFSISKGVNLNVAVGVNNIFNTSFRNYLNRLRFFADDLGRNVTLQLRINY